MPDTFGGATKRDIAIATIIGVFILVGSVVATGAYSCTDACPTFTQTHFDRFVDLIMYIGFAGAIYIGLKSAMNAQAKNKN